LDSPTSTVEQLVSQKERPSRGDKLDVEKVGKKA
jgi:hypothetical protein